AHLVLPAPGEHRRSRTDLARLQQVTQRLRGRVERDDRHDRRVPRRGDVVRVPVDHRLPRPHRVTLETCTVNPAPCCLTVSIPRCTSTARPSSPATTNAWGCSVATVPVMGATASP